MPFSYEPEGSHGDNEILIVRQRAKNLFTLKKTYQSIKVQIPAVIVNTTAILFTRTKWAFQLESEHLRSSYYTDVSANVPCIVLVDVFCDLRDVRENDYRSTYNSPRNQR